MFKILNDFFHNLLKMEKNCVVYAAVAIAFENLGITDKDHIDYVNENSENLIEYFKEQDIELPNFNKSGYIKLIKTKGNSNEKILRKGLVTIDNVVYDDFIRIVEDYIDQFKHLDTKSNKQLDKHEEENTEEIVEDTVIIDFNDEDDISTFKIDADDEVGDDVEDTSEVTPKVNRTIAGNKTSEKPKRTVKSSKSKSSAVCVENTFANKGSPYSLRTDTFDISSIPSKTTLEDLESIVSMDKSGTMEDLKVLKKASVITDEFLLAYVDALEAHKEVFASNLYSSVKFTSKANPSMTVKNAEGKTIKYVISLSKNTSAAVRTTEMLIKDIKDELLKNYYDAYANLIKIPIDKSKLTFDVYFNLPTVTKRDSSLAINSSPLSSLDSLLFNNFGIISDDTERSYTAIERSPLNYHEHALMVALKNFAKAPTISSIESVFNNRYAFTETCSKELVDACLRSLTLLQKYVKENPNEASDECVKSWLGILSSPTIIEVLCDVSGNTNTFNKIFKNMFKKLYSSVKSLKLMTHCLYPISCLFTPLMIGANTHNSSHFSIANCYSKVKSLKSCKKYSDYITNVYNIETETKVKPHEIWTYYMNPHVIGQEQVQMSYTIFKDIITKKAKENVDDNASEISNEE